MAALRWPSRRERVADAVTAYLNAQVAAGAQAPAGAPEAQDARPASGRDPPAVHALARCEAVRSDRVTTPDQIWLERDHAVIPRIKTLILPILESIPPRRVIDSVGI